jgi:hypothetical protein
MDAGIAKKLFIMSILDCHLDLNLETKDSNEFCGTESSL